MPEMEKGRPPENKRSRKPAHPVKREINQEMKTFAESTMNELLGWYGYDKVELRDSDASEMRGYPNRERRQHVSVLKENSASKPKSLDSKASPSALAMRSGERESSSVPSSSSSPSSSLTSPKEHKTAPVIVPLIKPSAVEDVQNVQIVCVWCQKEGVKRYSLCMGSELKSFCSEKCFAACRRAYFKRNKARDEDLHGDRSPQHPPHPDDSARLVLKMNSGARVCDWCKHVRHTKEYLDFGAGEERLHFCSTKCLNQYKMDVFYREARAALTSSSPGGAGAGAEGKTEPGAAGGQKLLTPESWGPQRTLSPKGPTPIHGTAAPTSVSPSEASSSSSKVPVAGLRPLERHLPLPPPPPMEAGPRHSPLPLRPHMEQHPHPPPPQIPLPFIRPPLHAQGLKSPLAAHPPRHPGPPSSPIHRPPHSPHLHPPSASSMNPPGLMHPYPGAYFPGLHSPPINMMPRGPAPFPPPMMNFGIPSFGPLLPQPTVLVPYPIIIPFPVPIPIPIPIPVPHRAPPDPPPAHGGVIQPVPEGAERGRSRGVRLPSPGTPVAVRTSVQGLPSPPGPHRRDSDWVKSERQHPSPATTPHSRGSSPGGRYNGPPGPDGPADSKPELQPQQERQVIQRLLQRTQVKQELNPQGVVDLSGPGGPGGPGAGQGARAGHYDGVRPPGSPSRDAAAYHRDSNTPPSHATPSPGGATPPFDDASPAQMSPDGLNRATSSLDRPPSPDSSSSSSSSSSQPPREAPPPAPALSELEAVKENSCGVGGGVSDAPNAGGPPDDPPIAGGEGDDPHVPDEDHAYALPTAPRATPATANATALLLPKLRDKGALRTPPGVGGGDTEPALKRRCLRIRDQNK